MKNLQGDKIADYDYNYTYKQTRITHKIEEFYDSKRKIRLVLLRKETRKGDMFIKLPSSIWVTCPGYPPLSTDAAMKNSADGKLSLFFAGLPTVQSNQHIKIFDDYLKEKLTPLGVDYEASSKALKERSAAKNIAITGFIYMKHDVIDEDIASRFLGIVCDAYELVLQSEAHECPVHEWRERIIGEQAVSEFYLFKNGGFDVPLSGQRAFFTMLMDEREPAENPDAD